MRQLALDIQDTGLKIRRRPSLPEWRDFGESLIAIVKRTPWAIGDWVNIGLNYFGEDSSQYLPTGNPEFIEYAFVAERIPQAIRKKSLSYSVHKLIAFHKQDGNLLPANGLTAMLEKAEAEEWKLADCKEALGGQKKLPMKVKALSRKQHELLANLVIREGTGYRFNGPGLSAHVEEWDEIPEAVTNLVEDILIG